MLDITRSMARSRHTRSQIKRTILRFFIKFGPSRRTELDLDVNTTGATLKPKLAAMTDIPVDQLVVTGVGPGLLLVRNYILIIAVMQYRMR